MNLYRNLASGRFFIGINEDIEEIEEFAGLLLITPEGKIKRLEEHLFEAVEPTGMTESEMPMGILTHAQRSKHQEIMGGLLQGRQRT